MTGFKKTTAKAGLAPNIAEIRAAAFENPDKFIQNYLKVVDKVSGVVDFKYNHAQQTIAKVIREEKKANHPLRLNILKSRRVGTSTFFTYRNFVHTWAHDNLNALVLAQLDETAETLLSRVKFCQAAMRPELRLPLCQDSRFAIQFANSLSKLTIASSRNLDAARGPTFQRLLITEFSYYKKAKDALVEFMQPMKWDIFTEAIIESTGKGWGSYAHDLWERSKAGKSAFRAVFLDWRDDPECTYAFDSDKDRDLRISEAIDYEPRLKDRMRQYHLTPGQLYYSYLILKNVLDGDWALYLIDYPCDDSEPWMSKQLSYFGTENVNKLRVQTSEYPYQYRVFPEGMALDQDIVDIDSFEKLERVEKIDENGDRPFFKVWAYPRPSCDDYVVSGDSAQGLQGGDFSCSYVMDMKTFEMMAEFHGKVRPDQHGYIMAFLGHLYNTALAAPEINPPGNVAFMTMQSVYTRFYRYKHPYMDNVVASKNTSRHLAWQTNTVSRPTMLSFAKQVVEDLANDRLRQPGILKSRELLTEMSNFADEGSGRPEAISGAHDDRVFAWSICVEVARQEMYGTEDDTNALYRKDSPPGAPPQATMEPSNLIVDPADVIRNFAELWQAKGPRVQLIEGNQYYGQR